MRYLLVLLAICLIGCELPVELESGLAELEVVNGLGYYEITELYICLAEGFDGWGDNWLDDALLDGESIVFMIEPGNYWLRAVVQFNEYRRYAEVPIEGYCWVVGEW